MVKVLVSPWGQCNESSIFYVLCVAQRTGDEIGILDVCLLRVTVGGGLAWPQLLPFVLFWWPCPVSVLVSEFCTRAIIIHINNDQSKVMAIDNRRRWARSNHSNAPRK